MLLVGVEKTTNIGFVGDDVRSAGHDNTEAGFQITAEIPPLISFSVKVSGKSASSTKFIYLFLFICLTKRLYIIDHIINCKKSILRTC